MFAREGYLIIAVSIAIALALVVIARAGPDMLRPILWLLAALIVGFTLYFFRDPARTAPAEAVEGTAFVAPADGKVVLIQDVEEPLYLKGPARQVSIFLSPLNVHVNRAPTGGVVEYVDYVPGDYLVAWHPKASEKNERSLIGVRRPDGQPVLFKQIAGAVARRVVNHLQVGDTVVAGERFGIVKFGSRMDILVDPASRILVSEGDRVRAGETVLGHFPDTSSGRTEAEFAGSDSTADR